MSKSHVVRKLVTLNEILNTFIKSTAVHIYSHQNGSLFPFDFETLTGRFCTKIMRIHSFVTSVNEILKQIFIKILKFLSVHRKFINN